jgi:hypothetical protein
LDVELISKKRENDTEWDEFNIWRALWKRVGEDQQNFIEPTIPQRLLVGWKSTLPSHEILRSISFEFRLGVESKGMILSESLSFLAVMLGSRDIQETIFA